MGRTDLCTICKVVGIYADRIDGNVNEQKEDACGKSRIVVSARVGSGNGSFKTQRYDAAGKAEKEEVTTSNPIN